MNLICGFKRLASGLFLHSIVLGMKPFFRILLIILFDFEMLSQGSEAIAGFGSKNANNMMAIMLVKILAIILIAVFHNSEADWKVVTMKFLSQAA